jgi:NAD(P)-dependent dehydrogenase (short-subunit alcohol dehydrogenase family)
MEINAFAPLKISEALLPNMPDGSKIANITSRMGSIADNSSGGRYGYRASKEAFNALGRSLAVDLKGRGIAVAQLHPGFVKTRMVNFGGLITPQESAAGLAERIGALNLENSGSFCTAMVRSSPGRMKASLPFFYLLSTMISLAQMLEEDGLLTAS